MKLCFSFWLLFWSQWNYGCLGCQDKERSALLDIKAAFDVPGYTSRLDSWVRDGPDCCSWERVGCGSVTGRVIRLDLHSARPFVFLGGGDYWKNFFFTMNTTLFLPIDELRTLILSHNNIIGCLPDSGYQRWSKLSKLEYLDLSLNYVPDADLPSIGAITSLKAFSLRERMSGGYLPIHGLTAWSKLSKLEYLDLSTNQFNQSIIPALARIPSLKTLLLNRNTMVGRLPIRELSMLDLEVLDLSNNEFDGRIPALIQELTSLKALSFSSNMLSGTIPTRGLCKMKDLQELDLSQNYLTGVLPSCLGNLTSLKLLDVSNNQIQSDFPSSIIASLTSVEYLSLSNNQFEGAVFLSIFSNHSDLRILELSNNEFDVKTEYQSMSPKFQLEAILLSNCNLNKESGTIPKFLSTQYSLEFIDLSYNQLRGYIPNWLLDNKTKLVYISLQNNFLSGPLVLPFHLNTNMSLLDLSQNELYGEIPSNIGTLLPNLLYLNLSGNSLHGSIPYSFNHMSQLENIDLSNNNLSGQITDDLVGNLSSLNLLFLSNNKFHGRVPSRYSSTSQLIAVLLDENQFTGEFPTGLCNISHIEVLDISKNLLSGKLPNCIVDLSLLAGLNLKGNDICGHIPTNLFNSTSLEYLDLSTNHLSGSIPTCSNQSSLQYLHLNNNHLKGFLPIDLFRCPDLVTIDIRNNHLSGKLPSSIWGTLSTLKVLLLTGNHLEGSIPKEMCNLKYLRIIDLSHNNLSGYIPSCVHHMGNEDAAFDTFVYYWSYTTVKDSLLPSYRSLLPEVSTEDPTGLREEDQVQLSTKNNSYTYEGDALGYVSGLDLSCNQLVGNIPLEIGSMNWLQTLNLSYNHLSGPIPDSLSNLEELESLDLSHNILTGPIPHELVGLHYLEAFSVAYNNLSGRTPGTDAQFITFDASSYEGNPNLCGRPLEKNCSTELVEIPLQAADEEDDAADHLILFASFVMSFVMGFWGYMAVLYFNAKWRRALYLAVDGFSYTLFS